MSTPGSALSETELRAGEMQEATVRTPRATAQTMQTLQRNNIDRVNYVDRMRGHMPLNRLPGAWQGWGQHHSQQLLQALQRSNTKWAYPLHLELGEEHEFAMIWTGGAKVVMKVGDQIWAYQMQYEQPPYDCTYCANLREWLPDWALLNDSLEGDTVTLGHRWNYFQALNQLVSEACRIIRVDQIPNQFVRRELWLLQHGPQPDPTNPEEVTAFRAESLARRTAAQERSAKYRKAKWSNMKRWSRRIRERTAAKKTEDTSETRDESERDDREPQPDRQTLCQEATTSAERSRQPATELEDGPDEDNVEAERADTKPNPEHQTLCRKVTPSVDRAGQVATGPEEVSSSAYIEAVAKLGNPCLDRRMLGPEDASVTEVTELLQPQEHEGTQRPNDEEDELPELEEPRPRERGAGESAGSGASGILPRMAGTQRRDERKRKRDQERVTTATSWEPGSYIAPQHLYTVGEALDRTRNYVEGEMVAAPGDWHFRWQVAKVLQGTDNLGFLSLDQGRGRSPTRILHTRVRGLQIRCTRVPGDIVGPPDMLLIREHQGEYEHAAGDTVVFYDIDERGVPLFRYAKVEELDMDDDNAAPGMFQLHGGSESGRMVRSQATFFRLDLTCERREAQINGTATGRMGQQSACWRCPNQQQQVAGREPRERTTKEGWYAGHYVDPEHEHMVESTWNVLHEYGWYEKAALRIQHPTYKYQVVEMAVAPAGTTVMDWRTVYHGPGQRATKENPQNLRVVRRPDSRILGDPLLKDRELLRGNRVDTIHRIGALVAVATARADDQYDFTYARVISGGEVSTDGADSITDILSQRLYLLDEGGQGVSPLRSGLQIFALRPGEQTEESEAGDYIQEVPGRGKGLVNELKKTAWRNDDEVVTVPPQTLELQEGMARRSSAPAGAKGAEARRSQFFTEPLRMAAGPIFLKREWQGAVPLGEALDLCLEGGKRMRATFEISGSDDQGVQTGASTAEEAAAHKAACAALILLLPTQRQRSRNLRQGKCRVITCRQEGQADPVAVVFFRRLRPSSTDEGGYVIDGLGTEEKSRGNGIGTALLRLVIETALQECGQGGNPRTYIGSVPNTEWWLTRMGCCRAEETRGLDRGAGNFAMVWNPTQHNLCEPFLYSEIQWSWKAQPIHNRSNWCHLISILQLLFATTAFTDLLRGAQWPLYGVGHTMLTILMREQDDALMKGYGPKSVLLSGQLLLRLWSGLCRRLPHLVRKESLKEEERDVQETLDAIIQALQDEQAEQNPSEAILRPPFGHDLWSSQVSWKDRCTKCKTERRSTDGHWMNYLLVEVNEGEGDLLHRLHHPRAETIQCSFDGCECGAPIERTPVVDSTNGMVLILVGRAAHEQPGARLGGKIPCPLTMALNTSHGTRALECSGVVAHGALESRPYKGKRGRVGVQIQSGHFITIINRLWEAYRPTAILLDDSKKSVCVGHDTQYCPLEQIIPKHELYVEAMALYVDLDPMRPTGPEHSLNRLLRDSLATLGIAVQEVRRGSIGATGETSIISMPKGTARTVTSPDLQEPVHWSYSNGSVVYSGLLEAELWNRPILMPVRVGHTGKPMLSPLPTVCWAREGPATDSESDLGIHETTLLLFACSDLRNLDIATGSGDSDIDFNQLVWQVRRRGKAAGRALRCRAISLSDEYPIATWPADWICFVIGGRAAEAGRRTLVMTAWRPRTTAETATAQGTLRNLEADERARQHLQNLQFEPPVMETAEAWLQNRWGQGAAEMEIEVGPPVRNSGTGNGDCATPVEEPMKYAAP